MGAGKLDRRVTVQRYGEAYNEFNEPVQTWSDYIRVWASRREATGQEQLIAQQRSAEITTVFEVRYSTQAATITPKDRIYYGDKHYLIVSVTELEPRRSMIQITTRVADNG